MLLPEDFSTMTRKSFLPNGIMPAKLANAVGTEGVWLPNIKIKQTEFTHMAKYKLEYIWLDGYEPVANLRGKTQVKEFDSFPGSRRATDVGI